MSLRDAKLSELVERRNTVRDHIQIRLAELQVLKKEYGDLEQLLGKAHEGSDEAFIAKVEKLLNPLKQSEPDRGQP